MDKLFLITGAAGHLGSTIIRLLLEQGKQVRALVVPGEKHIPEGVEVIWGDVCDRESLRPFFENLDGRETLVIHCAGIVSIASGFLQKVHDVNVCGTKNIVDLCGEHRVSKLVHVSSVHAIPEKPRGQVITEITDFDPDRVVGLYAKTKAEATAYVLEATKKGLAACVVHPSGISGPYDYGKGHLTALVTDYYKGQLTSGVGGGYDFVDVRDVAAGILSALENGRPGECYILSNQFYSVREVLNVLHKATGKRKIRSFLPLWFVKLTAPMAELYYKIRREPPLFTPYSIYTLNSNAMFSHEKASRELGYTARPLKETLEDTVAWLKTIERI